jgi:hypothetical protein
MPEIRSLYGIHLAIFMELKWNFWIFLEFLEFFRIFGIYREFLEFFGIFRLKIPYLEFTIPIFSRVSPLGKPLYEAFSPALELDEKSTKNINFEILDPG